MNITNNKGKCTGCGACEQICPVNAISMQEDDEGFEYPLVSDEKCLKCGLCRKVCPIKGRVAIITLFTGNYNYGAQLQNYAVQYYLRQHYLACDTLWGFTYPRPECFYFFRDVYRKIFNRILDRVPFVKLNQKTLYRDSFVLSPFQRDMINVGPKVNTRHVPRKINELYDFFCVGSDIVWNGYSDYYFLRFCDKTKRVCMVPSMCSEDVLEEKIDLRQPAVVNLITIKHNLQGGLLKLFKRGLAGFEHICVREEGAVKTVEAITGEKCERLIDPTLLIDGAEWHRIMKKPKSFCDKKYMLMYFFKDLPEESLNVVKQYAADFELIILDVLKDLGDGFNTRPEEFLFWIKNAEVVLTDSFHGTCFSIVFRKKFYSFTNGREIYKGDGKISSLLSVFNMEDRIRDDNISKDCLLSCGPDFSDTEDILSAEREKATAFFEGCGLFCK